MKTIPLTILASTLMFVLAGPLRAQAAEVSDVISDHQAMAASYEEKAAQQDTIIAEHQKMKKDYKSRFFVNEKVTPISRIQKMETHCNQIIASAQQLKNEFLRFAQWHKMRAAELQGQ